MSYKKTARRRRRRTIIPAALIIINVTLIGTFSYRLLSAWSSSAPAPEASEPPEFRPNTTPSGDLFGAAGAVDGAVPSGVTVFDVEFPAVAKLDADLIDALRRAATDAANDGVEFIVNSGWRSAEYQDRLLRAAIAEYGSKEAAARWVGTADTSAHVSGNAVDIGPFDATVWLSEHGAEYGLCQIYRNEPWHYELRPLAADYGCPPMYADPTYDPRMQP